MKRRSVTLEHSVASALVDWWITNAKSFWIRSLFKKKEKKKGEQIEILTNADVATQTIKALHNIGWWLKQGSFGVLTPKKEEERRYHS